MATQTTWSHWEVIMCCCVSAGQDQKVYENWAENKGQEEEFWKVKRLSAWGVPTEDWHCCFYCSQLCAALHCTSQQNSINCIFVCVFQRTALRLQCTSDMLCPETSVQADPPPRLRSSHIFPSRQWYAALHLSSHLFSLSTWRLWAGQPENLGSEGTLHESKPAAITVWCFRASVGRGECVAAGRQ